MNDDLSNILNNFSDILKEKNIDLNGILGGDNPPENNSDEDNNDDNFSFDINTILKIKEIMSAMNGKNGPRNKLLHSLKPYLQDTKKEKLEQYIKIANLLSALDSVDDNHYLKFLKNDDYDFILMIILFLLIF